MLRNISKVVCANMKQQDVPAAAKHSTKRVSERCTVVPPSSSDEMQRTSCTWPVPSFTVQRNYLNWWKTGGQGTRQHPGREARREEDSCSLGTTPHCTAPHRPVPGWTTSQRCTQAASAPTCPRLDPCRSKEFSPSFNKNSAEKNKER